MASCSNWVDSFAIACDNATSQIDDACTSWADEGSNECSEWADEGSSECTSWSKCHWYTPWDCIAGFFCRAYYWVAKWVCKGWYWVAKWVCKGFTWLVNALCVIGSWVLHLGCFLVDTLRCAVLAIGGFFRGFFGKSRPEPRIEHVFVLMLENRSFDHMLAFSGITGTDENGNPTEFNPGFDPTTTSTNLNPLTMTNVPASTGADFALKGVDEGPPHEFVDGLINLTGKTTYDPTAGYPTVDNSGFIQAYVTRQPNDPTRVMRCFDADQLRVMNALAREFAVCDAWFSSMPGPTWPNRFFTMAATSGGLDGSPSDFDVAGSETIDGYRFLYGNIFDRLDTHCVPWRIFEGDEFPVAAALRGMNVNALRGRFTDLDDFEDSINRPGFDERFSFIEPKYGAHEFDATGPGDYSCGNSMHPLDDVTRGEALIKRVYEAIRGSTLWNRSLLIITFDEHGGFYDHVRPGPAVPPGDTETVSTSQFGFKFDQLGARVPALVISPLIRRGVIDHTQYDHTSVLATIERVLNIGSLTDRDAKANDVLHLLNLPTPRTDTPTTLPEPAVNPKPLGCDDETVQTPDMLLLKRSELRLARTRGQYRDRELGKYPLDPAQVGFLHVALLKVLRTARAPERAQWIEDYKRIKTGVDAALFMLEAKLKLRHGMDLKRMELLADRAKPRPRRRKGATGS